jgi:hypothetical protein
MPKHDFIFVDESGDPGYATDPKTGELTSSEYYASAALHVCDDSISHINAHIASFRYYTGMNRELKLPPEKEVFNKLLEPIQMLAQSDKNIWASAVYLDKRKYTGRYLKAGGDRPQNPVHFRNSILRYLLEHHFQRCPLQSKQYDLVLDRVEMTRNEIENLRKYLASNYNIPTPT